MIYKGKQTIFNHIEQNSLYNMILNEDEINNVEKDGKSSVKMRFNKYLVSSGLGDFFEIFNAFLSFSIIIINTL